MSVRKNKKIPSQIKIAKTETKKQAEKKSVIQRQRALQPLERAPPHLACGSSLCLNLSRRTPERPERCQRKLARCQTTLALCQKILVQCHCHQLSMKGQKERDWQHGKLTKKTTKKKKQQNNNNKQYLLHLSLNLPPPQAVCPRRCVGRGQDWEPHQQ